MFSKNMSLFGEMRANSSLQLASHVALLSKSMRIPS